jgi:hypothetical protein
MSLANSLKANLSAQKSAAVQIREMGERVTKLKEQFGPGYEQLSSTCARWMGVTALPTDVVGATPEIKLDFIMRALESGIAYEALRAAIHQ